MPTVSFHMGDDYCSIDLATSSVSSKQIEAAEKRSNQVVFENRPVRVRYVSRAEAEKLGLRKLPPAERDELRLIEVADFDLSACGGTHVGSSGQIGSIALRKTEKVRQGTRVEFVCGWRVVCMAGATTLRSVTRPRSSRATLGCARADSQKRRRQQAVAQAKRRCAGGTCRADCFSRSRGAAGDERAEDCGADFFRPRHQFRQVVCPEADASGNSRDCAGGKHGRRHRPGIRTVGRRLRRYGALLKQVLSSVGGRGGGTRDFAQGGVPAGSPVNVEQLLRDAAVTIGA